MNIEMMVQNLTADVAQSAKIPQGANSGQDDFETMLREQSKTAQEQKPQEKPQEKTEATTEEKVDQPSQKEDGPNSKPNSTKDQEVSEAGYQVAAALVTSQPVVPFEFLPQAKQESAPVAAPVEAAPEMSAAQVSENAGEYLNTMEGQTQPQTKPQQAEEPAKAGVEEPAAAPSAEGETGVPVQKPVEGTEAQAQPENDLKETNVPHQVKVERGPAKSQAGEEKPEAKTFSGEQLGTPVFSGKSVPVKVAEPTGEPVAAQEPDMPQQVANRINTALAQGETRVEIQLNPENLGKLTVEIVQGVDGGLNVVFTATTAKAAALLQQHSSGLQNAMASNAQAPVTVEVQQPQQAEDANNQFLNPDGQNRQNQQRQQQEQKHKAASDDFIQQLRLGLVELRGE